MVHVFVRKDILEIAVRKKVRGNILKYAQKLIKAGELVGHGNAMRCFLKSFHNSWKGMVDFS